LLAAQSDVDLAAALNIVAREFPNPEFSFDTSKISSDGHGNSTFQGNSLWDRSYDTIFAVNQLFEIGGKRSSRKQSAAAGLLAAEARLRDARRVLDLGVTQAYIDALLAQANADVLRDSAASLRQEAAIAERRFQAGDISRTDQSQIEIAADRLELDARTAQNVAGTARIAVEVFLGIDKPRGDWQPSDSLADLVKPPAALPQGDVAPTRPDLIALDAGVNHAEADLRLQKAQRVPDPTVSFGYEHEPPGELTDSIGFGLRFPLPLWNRNRGGIQAAQVVREQATLRLRKREAEIAAEIEVARRNYASAAERLRQQHDEILPRSTDVRKTISLAYEKGGASLLDLLSAQRTDNEVRLAAAQAAAETARALAVLKAALNFSETNSPPP
jgi:cobalt-zinc-cadmium efflux system outer membrane protein